MAAAGTVDPEWECPECGNLLVFVWEKRVMFCEGGDEPDNEFCDYFTDIPEDAWMRRQGAPLLPGFEMEAAR